jgi:hypothetical protein
MKAKLASFASLLFITLSSAQAAPVKSPGETLEEMLKTGTPVAFAELDGAWLVGLCYDSFSTQPAFHIATTGFQKTFGEGRGPLFPAFNKGYLFASVYDSDARFGQIHEDRLIELESQKNAMLPEIPENLACWDSRTEETACGSTRLVANETKNFPSDNDSLQNSLYMRQSGDYYVSSLYVRINGLRDSLKFHCYQTKLQAH